VASGVVNCPKLLLSYLNDKLKSSLVSFVQ
jgi:hypothetical protein